MKIQGIQRVINSDAVVSKLEIDLDTGTASVRVFRPGLNEVGEVSIKKVIQSMPQEERAPARNFLKRLVKEAIKKACNVDVPETEINITTGE